MPAGRAGWGWGRWLQGPFPSWILAVCLPQSLLLVNRALGAWDNREEEHDFPLADADATRSRHGGSGEHSTLSVSFVVEVKPSTVACAPWPTGAAGRVAATTFPVLPAAQPPLGDTAASLWRGGSVPSREGSRREALLRSGMVGRARAISQTNWISSWDADGASRRDAVLAGERRCVPEDRRRLRSTPVAGGGLWCWGGNSRGGAKIPFFL